MKTEQKKTPFISFEVITDGLRHGESPILGIVCNGKEYQLNFDQLPKELRLQAEFHGFRQKLADACAAPKGTPASYRVAEFEAVLDNIKNNHSWNRRKGESEGVGRGSLLYKALLRLGYKEEKIVPYLENLDKAQQAALRAQSKVAQAILEIKAEEGDQALGDSLLEGLE